MSEIIQNNENLMDAMLISEISNESAIAVSEKLQNAYTANSFTLLNIYNYHEIVAEKGYPIERKVFVHEICHAKLASKLLIVYPEFSAFMPCRIAIYEKDSVTVISTMNMDLMLQTIQNNQELFQEANTLFESIKNMIKSFN